MARHIDVETLRTWLDDHRPVTIVDVRDAKAHAEWAIPGSLRVDAPIPTDLPLPADHPVVTVCNLGRTSAAAAEALERRGLDAWSLTGGMQAWSLAWNVAGVPLPGSSAQVTQVRRTGKGCLSYVIASQGEAAIVDPSIDIEVYLSLLARGGWRLRHVIDTHIHADHLSRARGLAARTGAMLWLPDQPRARFPFHRLGDGLRLDVGAAALTAVHAPGHTDESLALLLDGVAAFTADTLFTTSVGRPDLKADEAAGRTRARRLFASLQTLAALPPATMILPGHTGAPVPFDGVPIAARLGDVREWLDEWLAVEARFIERVVSHLPETPPNFARIVELNEAGAGPGDDPAVLEAGANRCAVGR